MLLQRLDAKLSDQQQKLQDGSIPMPLYTCLHVKKHVSAMIFHGQWDDCCPLPFRQTDRQTDRQTQTGSID